MAILYLQSDDRFNLYIVNKFKSKSFKLMKTLQVARFAEGKTRQGGPPASSSLLPFPVGWAAEQDAEETIPEAETLKS